MSRHRQTSIPPGKITIRYGDLAVTQTQDGMRHAEGVSFLMHSRPGQTINGVPAAIAMTLADFEDDQGRSLSEQRDQRLAGAS